jgi:F-type H+-transporting ATPase subunit b
MVEINLYEIVLQLINFGLMYLFLNKFMFKPLSVFLKDRSDSIQGSYDDVEKTKIENQSLIETATAELVKAREQGQKIIAQAKDLAGEEKNVIVAKAKEQYEQMVKNAHHEIDAIKEKAQQEIKENVLDLSLSLAGKVLGKELDAKANEAFVNKELENVSL